MITSMDKNDASIMIPSIVKASIMITSIIYDDASIMNTSIDSLLVFTMRLLLS